MLNQYKILSLSCLTSAIALTSVPVFAEDNEQSIDEVVVSANRIARPASQVGSSVTVIDADDIKRRQETSVADLLRGAAGVNISRNGGLGGVTSLRLRGADSGQVMVAINGIKINDLASPGGGTNFANLFTDGIKRVEILRGPQSTLYGSDAMGGVIAIETSSGDDTGLSGFAEVGSYATRRVGGAVGLQFGDDISGMMRVGHVRSDGISAADENDGNTEADGYESLSLLGSLDAEIGADITLSGFVRAVESSADVDAYDFVTGGYADADDAEDTDDRQIGSSLSFDLLGGRVENRINLSWANIDRSSFVAGEKSFAATSRRRALEYLGHADLNETASLVFGAESEKNRITTESFGFWASSEAGNADINSAFGEAQIEAMDSVHLSIGVRQDDHAQFGGHTSLRGTLAWQVMDQTLIRTNWGEGFKAPTLYQLFSAYGDQDLVPETSRGWEIGAEQGWGEKDSLNGRVSATYFDRDTDNQIDFSFATFTYANLNQTEAKGVELALQLRDGEKRGIDLNYTWLDATDRDTGLALMRRPENSFNAEAFTDLGNDMQASVGLTHVGKQQDVAGEMPGYTVVDARWSWAIRDGVEVYARIDNLLDKEYQQVSGYGTPDRSVFAGIRLEM